MKSIVIAEIMGRNAGWLTAAAALSNNEKVAPVDIVILPEVAFCQDKFLARLEDIMKTKDSTIIAVSEGIKDSNGKYIAESNAAKMNDGFNHASLGGAGKIVEDIVKNNIGIKTRSIEFSTLQRCSAQNISFCDYEESFRVGYEGAAHAIEGNTGFMAGFKRVSDMPYKSDIDFFPVNNVANLEKSVFSDMIGEDKMSVTQKFVDYALPLINGEPELIYTNGVLDFEII